MTRQRERFVAAQSLQNLLVAEATGGSGDEAQYQRLRMLLLAEPATKQLVPEFLRTCRDLFQFWQFVKHQFGTYKERREFLWDQFRPLLEALESEAEAPADAPIAQGLIALDAGSVGEQWEKALERKRTDPEGAITMARTLIESVCKHILDELGIAYADGADLPQLYKATAENLGLAPSQHTEEVFRQILGGCSAIVGGLGALRNKLSDAHGRGRAGAKPATRHAELAVNLAGAMATFLVATWAAREERMGS